MKTAIDFAFRLASVMFIFWPWLMAIASGVYWFFGLPAFFEWTGNRIGFAIFWPFGAAPVWFFLLWVSE